MVDYTDLLGVQYKKNGRDKKGLDCYGLVKTIYDRMGRDLPDYDTPDETSLIYELVNDVKQESFTKLTEPQEGCIVLFSLAPFSLHMGIVLHDKERFVHILENRNVAVEKLNHRIWSKLLIGYYEWKI